MFLGYTSRSKIAVITNIQLSEVTPSGFREVGVITCTSPSKEKAPMGLYFLQHTLLSDFLLFVSLIVALIPISLNENDVEELLIYVLSMFPFL